MKKRLVISLVWAFSVTVTSFGVGARNQVGDKSEVLPPCVLASASADDSVNRGTGSLRSDDGSATHVLAEFQSAIKQECARFSGPQALRHVEVRIGENHIVISGIVPNEADEERLLSLALDRANGRTVFNRLSLEQSTEKVHVPVR